MEDNELKLLKDRIDLLEKENRILKLRLAKNRIEQELKDLLNEPTLDDWDIKEKDYWY